MFNFKNHAFMRNFLSLLLLLTVGFTFGQETGTDYKTLKVDDQTVEKVLNLIL